jgi:hypothetical protein
MFLAKKSKKRLNTFPQQEHARTQNIHELYTNSNNAVVLPLSKYRNYRSGIGFSGLCSGFSSLLKRKLSNMFSLSSKQ